MIYRTAYLMLPLVGCTLTELEDLQGNQGGASAAASTSGTSTSRGAAGGDRDAYASVVLADMPIGYWRLGEESGAEARDESGSHHGQYFGNVMLGAVGATDGNTAARFDGSTGYMSVENFPGFEGTLPFSLEAWVEPNLSTETHGILGQARYDGVSGIIDGYRLYFANETLHFERSAYDGTDSIAVADALPLRAYSHVVLAYDGQTMELFLNGESVTSASSFRPISAYGTFGVGADLMYDSFEVVSHFSGSIDEVAVYDHALTAAQIAAHYTAGR